MAKRISIQMNPLMKEVGTKVINPTPTFNEIEYEKALEQIAKNAQIKTPDFGDIDDADDHQTISYPISKDDRILESEISPVEEKSEINSIVSTNETPFKFEPPTTIERGFKFESPTIIERDIETETPFNPESGFKNEGPVIIESPFKNETSFNNESPTKKKGAYLIDIDINLIEREKLPIDCIRLEAVVRSFYKKKHKKDEWVQISRDMLQINKINGARLKETRFICKNRGIIDFKIENEGVQGKERVLYKLVK
jgi:hypothetical protein